jgi:transglutaminase-like putative cysteine protease
MKRLTIEAIHSQAPRQVALELIRGAHVADPSLFVDALRNWLLIHVDVIDEFEELLISPVLMLDDIDKNGRTGGDCDDIAMLAASILSSIGALTRFAACFPQSDGSYAHVFVQYKFPRDADFQDFDATIGYETPVYPADVLTVDVIS